MTISSSRFAGLLLALTGFFAFPNDVRCQDPIEPNETVHNLIVVDTFANNAHPLGITKEGELLGQLFGEILEEGNLDPKRFPTTILKDNQVTPQNILAYYKDLEGKLGPKDGVFFYYMGHGNTDPDKGHYLSLNGGRHLFRSDLLAAMQATNPRLLVLLTDCCANLKAVPGQFRDQILPPAVQPPPPGPWRMCYSLFAQHAGVVDINSCQPGEAASGAREVGGFLGVGFRGLLGRYGPQFHPEVIQEWNRTRETDTFHQVTWTQFADWLAKETEAAAYEIQQGFRQKPKVYQLPGGNLGIVAQPLVREVDQVEGWVVREVQPGSLAAQAGLRADDIVTAVNGTAAQDNSEWAQVLQRSGSRLNLTVQPANAPGSERNVQIDVPRPEYPTPPDYPPEPPLDLHEFAEAKAAAIAAEIRRLRGTTVPRVVVFPFGDADGRGSAVAGVAPITLQGELISELAKQATIRGQPEFYVLSAATANRVLGGRSAQGVGETRAETTEVLEAMEVDFAVVGQLGFSSLIAVQNEKVKTVPITLKLTAQNPGIAETSYDGVVDASDILIQGGSGPFNPTQENERFRVEIIGPAGGPLPLQVCTDPASEFHNSYFLILDKELHEQPYQIRITNLGTPAVGHAHANPQKETQRLFQVAVLVDGVNSIFEEGKDGFEAVTRHPYYVSRWVLTGPGVTLKEDPMVQNAELTGARLVAAPPGESGDVLTVAGFQQDRDQGREFLFTNAQESIAIDRRLFDNEVGLITVYFYAQQFAAQDNVEPWLEEVMRDNSTHPLTLSDAGTKEGQTFGSKTFPVTFPVYREPVQVWRIFYRYEGDDLPLDRGKALVPSSLKEVR